jgi:hypothetical protein
LVRRQAAKPLIVLCCAVAMTMVASCSSDHGASTGSPAQTSTSAGSTPGSSASGGIHATVPSRVQPVAPPAPIGSDAPFGGGITTRIISIKRIHAQANGPGEISGPAVQVTFEIRNQSKKKIDLGSVTANEVDSKGAPGVPMGSSPASPFRGSLAPGGRAKGTYVFSTRSQRSGKVTVTLSYSVDAPILQFVGDVR